MPGQDPAPLGVLRLRRPRRLRATLLVLGVALIAGAAAHARATRRHVAAPALVSSGDGWTFDYTGRPEQFTVPPGVTTITITAIGGSGEAIDEGGGPGNGGMTLSSFAVTPGDLLTVWVGGAGVPDGGWGFGCGGQRGDASFASFPGIGNGGGGGGSSAVTFGTTITNPGDCDATIRPDASAILTVAGGGGAGGGNGAVTVFNRGNAQYLYIDGGAGGDGGAPAKPGRRTDTIPVAGGCGGCERSPNGGGGGDDTIASQTAGSGGGGGGMLDGGGGGGATPPFEGGAAGGGGGGGESYIAPIAQVGRYFYQGGRGRPGSVTLTAGALQLFECSGETVTTEPPADLPVLAIVAQGAQGNVRSDGFAAAGGQGGVVGASFTLAAGTPVDVWVGCQSGWGWGTGGSRGDGKASEAYDGTNGGGSSAVFVGAGVGVVAGGGGGGGGEDFNHDDPDGVGGDGGQPAAGGHSGSGLFGTHAGGGCGGCVNAADGSGGSSSAAIALGGGGGGGGSGFLSGDGGRTKDSTNGGGGGGGTSWASDGAANVSFTTAVGEGDGYVQLTWMPGPGAAVSTYGGDRQEASPGTQFAEPLQALVTNSIGTPAVGLDVTFDLTPGGNAGTFAGQQGQVVTVQTDANGVATSPPILAGPPATGWPASAQVEVTGKTTWFALTNQGFPSTIALGLAPQPVTPGQDTGIEATVSGGANATSVPTGTVVFVVQGTSYVAPIVAGRAFLDLAPGTLTVGSSGVSASYFGDDVFGPSTTSLPLDVVPTTTTVAVTSSANPSTPGQGVTFTAAVSVATGNEQCDGCTVTFAADGVPLGTGTVDATGFATVGPITTLTDGSHTITASFDGGASYANSAGSMVQQVSAGLAVAVRVTTSPNPSQIGQAFDASVTVVPPAGGPVPTGLVTISMGGTPFCETMLTNGTADCEAAGTLLLLAGVNGITASYAGDGTYAPAAGAATQTIGLAATTTSVVPSAATVGAGQPVSFTVTVTSPFGGDLDPDGTVVLLDDGQPIAGLASVQITGGAVTTPPVTIASDGLHTISAVYQPVGTPPIWSPSIGSAQLAVVPVTTTVEVAAQAGKTLLGDAPRYVAEVKVAGQALAPEGAVLFSVNGLDRGAPVPLVDGRAASEPVAGLPTGDHDVVARFLPARGLGAASARFVHTVSQPTVVMAGASANPSRTRRRLRLRAHVGPIVPGGMLSFALDGRPIRGCQNVPVRHSTADCTTRVRKRGKHVVSVAYSGTHGHEPSTTRIEQIVRPGSKKTPRARRCARVPRPLPPEPGKCGR